jgi:hypothetical protein
MRTRIIDVTRRRQNQLLDNRTDPFFDVITTLFCCGICCPETITIANNQEAILLYNEVATEVLKEPGTYLRSSMGLEVHYVYLSWQQTLSQLETTHPDGYPCYLSAQYSFQVIDSLAATFAVKDFKKFVKEQAKNALAKCLLNEEKAKRLLNGYVKPIGVEISRFKITKVAVNPRFCQLVYKKQEAKAYVKGRHLIAEGAISTMSSTIQQLNDKGLTLSAQEKNSLATNLTYMLCQNDDLSLDFMQGNPVLEQLGAYLTLTQPNHHEEHK